jgi:hypothetical protein
MSSNTPGPAEPDENLMAGQRPLPWEPEIEHALKRLVLRSPSPELDAKVSRDLRRPRTSSRLRTACLAIAAAVAVAGGSIPLLTHYLRAAPIKTVVDRRSLPPARLKPASGPLRVERQIARVSDDGVIGTANGVPVQLYRYRALRQVWYFDPHTGKKLQVTVPQNEWVLVPVRTF